ncbi:MAG TPA: peptidase M61 [Gammaproteobacteria bacterium]|nr:peptidase M61 [Gammaproteobacteria bacterium]
MRATLTLAVVLLCAGAARAQSRSEPQPAAPPQPIEAPRDVRFPGVLKLEVDATDLDRRIFRFRESVPVAAPGPLVLTYPRWLPGHHSPTAEIRNFGGLTLKAGGRTLPWTRDTADTFAYHVDVPAGVTSLEIEGQYLSATESSQGAFRMTHEMLRLEWYTVALYPAGYFTRRIDVDASVTLPSGWQLATALETASAAANTTRFRTVSFDTLVDSPLIAGKHVRRLDLDPGGRSRVTLNVIADSPELLETTPQIEKIQRELVRQADKLYGARHYDHYDFLLTLSDRLAGSGLEHHRSSDNGVTSKYFATWDSSLISRDLLPHEYNHSWNGKFRRPADLWTPTFNVPMRDSLLWVYEGQTQYYGNVLAARAGFLDKQQALDSLALTAATYDVRAGRRWRPLQDTTNDPINAQRRPIPWPSWQRSEDYYSEGQLVWLEIDTLIRERSGNRRSLDDFARAFFGINDGDWGEVTYTFDDVVAALNRVEPYDWAALLRRRLDENAPGAPLDGLERGGYELVYTDEPTDFYKDSEKRRKVVDLTYSLGVVIDSARNVTAVLWDSPAFRSGLTTGTEVVALNGVAFDADNLRAIVKATKPGSAPIELLIKQGDTFRTLPIPYDGGQRYPRLQRVPKTRALLDDILAPRR